MRICQVSPGLAPVSPKYIDAQNAVIRNLTDQFTRAGHDVDIISLGGQDMDMDQGHSIYPIQIPMRLKNQPLLKQAYYSIHLKKLLPRLTKDNRYDIVHFHSPAGALFGCMGMKKRNVRTVYTNHNPNLGYSLPVDITNRWTLAKQLNVSRLPLITSLSSIYSESYAFKSVDRIVAVSNTQKKNIGKYFEISPSKIVHIPNGVNIDFFQPSPRSKGLEQQHGLEDCTVILCLARIAPYKNQMALVKAFDALKSDHEMVRLLFVGPIQPPFMGYYETILDYIRSHQLDDRIVFTGSVDIELLPEYYSLADLFVLPSISEGMPLVLLEAMSCGKPIVASAIPQNLELAENGDEMVFVDQADPADIADKIRSVIADTKRSADLSVRARHVAVTKYGWDTVAKKTIELYDTLRSQ